MPVYSFHYTVREPYGLYIYRTSKFLLAGENFILRASYRRMSKDTTTYTSLLPFFGTDYGLCTLIKPQITFDPKLKVSLMLRVNCRDSNILATA